MTSPFHPKAGDELVVADGSGIRTEPAAPGGERSFTPAIRHIHRVLRGHEAPRHLAVDDAMGNATAIAAVLSAARAGG
jgi:hypothetical protein